MGRLLTLLPVLFVLWLPFAAAGAMTIPVSLLGLLVWTVCGLKPVYDYTKNLLGGMDRAAGSLMGLDARYTISAHCGVNPKLFLLRVVLDKLAPGHCAGAAEKEGLRA